MRAIAKIVSFIIINLVFTLGIVVTVTAKNGPHVGPDFPNNTDACAGCHRTHTALGIYLLAEGTTVYGFCTSCHNGTGANTNVVDGRFEGTVTDYGTQGDGTPGNGLNGGGFLNAFAYTGHSSRNTGWRSISSRHRMNGLDIETSFIAWGGGVTGPGTEMPLDCTSCHNPHGTENPDGSERYRILQNSVNGTEVGLIRAHETAGKDYTSNRYRDGFSSFCSACHTQYILKVSWYDAGDNKGGKVRFRHTVPSPLLIGDRKTGNAKTIAENLNEHIQLPLEQTDSYSSSARGSDILNCLTCHQVHGSSIDISSSAKVKPANSSTLLRLENRGVCQDCHQR